MTDFGKRVHPLGYVEAVPRPSQAELDEFYAREYYKAGVSATYQAEYSAEEIAQKKLRATAAIEAIAQKLATGGPTTSFFEVGSGEGFLLAEAVRRGWAAKGVDFQSAPVAKFNPEALSRFIKANPNEYLPKLLGGGKTFSVIALQNVLEHALHPDKLLQTLRGIIARDGLLLLQVPNDYSRLQKLTMDKGRIEREYWFAPPQHLNYFNVQTLSAFVAAHRFEIVDGFADFPIEMYLWGAESNYTRDKTMGSHAHRARIELDLLMSEAGIKEYLDFYRSLYRVGFGRNLIVLLRPV